MDGIYNNMNNLHIMFNKSWLFIFILYVIKPYEPNYHSTNIPPQIGNILLPRSDPIQISRPADLILGNLKWGFVC